ncbi:hypothetical protein GGI25_003519 [Coemansia spiralis]|uniref:Uncharacterized protein n=2 Tax=Coemansia TaxID=4863 RepID=A0A9W8G1U6_9FUNG|nr:hypothetical protein BX070DRAFT_246917 [Coemansia spiralis]KAJ1990408.1 hypothetical protein EDC05_004052 [Coemansia umbellata]KAJ2622104.1 hypothetical protein GGI26_003546 [Coemansia sp. RSA 1358]KAJ2676484.1 hypothetical protein GGI25_003519 [Coemansia spiralis]
MSVSRSFLSTLASLRNAPVLSQGLREMSSKASRKAESYKQGAPSISPIGGNRVSVHEHTTIVNDEIDEYETTNKVDDELRNHEKALAQDAARAASEYGEEPVHLHSSPKYNKVTIMHQQQTKKSSSISSKPKSNE